MRPLLTVLAVLALAAPAQAATKRLTVDDTVRWTTPQKFGKNQPVQVDLFVNGRTVGNAHIGGKIVWEGQGVLARAKPSKRRGPIRFRIANFRDRDAKVRIVYRKL